MTTTLSDHLSLEALMDAPTTEHPMFLYSEKTRQYRYKDSGKFVPKAAFEKLTQDHISQKKAELRAIGERFADKGGFVGFQKDGWATIKITFTQQYLLGRGGIGRMEASDYATLKKELRYQGKMWRGFAVDIKAGGVSRAQLQMRLAMYGEASKVAFFDGEEAAARAGGMTEELNVMAPVENCPECIDRTAQGWKPIGTLGRITKNTSCRIYCHCTRQYRKGRKRKDALPSIPDGLVKKVITNVQGEQQTVYVRPGESKATALVEKHVTKTLITDKLPSREEFLEIAGAATEEFFKNPIKAISDGIKREQMARDAYKLAMGKDAPTKMQATASAMKATAKKMKKVLLTEDMLVNSAGFVSSVAGGATAGPVGALAGDLGGALAVRKMVEVNKAYHAAAAKLKDDEAFKAADLVSKIKMKKSQTISELKTAESQKAIEKELVGDTAGWAIGNASASALSQFVPPIAGIPLKGAAVALSTVPTIVVPIATKAHELRRNGATPQDAVKEAFSDYMTEGDKREAKMRAEFTKRMKELKASANKY